MFSNKKDEKHLSWIVNGVAIIAVLAIMGGVYAIFKLIMYLIS